jgi:hypothetical protein
VPDTPEHAEPGRPDDAGRFVRADRRTGRARRRPSVDEVFGEVLPDTTQDERDARRSRGRDARDDRDDEILRDVPPHHGS